MKVVLDSRSKYAERRRADILKQWPLTAQMEAHAEAAAGRPEKLQALLADIASIKQRYPKPTDGTPNA